MFFTSAQKIVGNSKRLTCQYFFQSYKVEQKLHYNATEFKGKE